MIRAYAVSCVREAEAAAMAGLEEGELMSRAASGLAAIASARLGGPGGRQVVAMVGAGNNGGDALYAVASLARDGASVAVLKVAESVHEGGLRAARDAGALVLDAVGGSAESAAEVSSALSRADLVIDGIVGIGGRPGLSPQVEGLLQEVGDTAYVLAVDLPSGTDPDGEVATQSCVFADETVTFIVPKPVHLLPATELAVGRLTVVDIGVDIGVGIGRAPVVERVTRDDVSWLWPHPGPADDKYSRGVLGIVAGGENYTGAALLAVTSAVCSGAGMVRYVGPPTPTLLIRSQVPEAVIGEGQVQAWLIGPGVDVGDESAQGRAQRAAAQSAMDSGLPCVVDAGGLDLIIEPRSTPTLLTPHAGELASLLSRLVGFVDRATVTSAPLTHARQLADLTNSTVLLKGATTLVVSPRSSGLAVRAQADAPSWLATAGSGDVLAGLAGTLLASGLSPLDSGSVAALVHGLAADAANPGGPVRALGVAHAIPGAVAAVMARRTARS
ncbi:MAG: bifunctional ADP-dependent NAD(P)H-hydrate dehydratase/NAD(P)H-hydrate epimerase [Actinobacteria bacterium]|nr:bifunctional ADP-dependent NAD(P)H-hydrate dehydratase/NAD(P)H-hydrate epimerase [Actinomycetota bacterium]